MDWTSLAVLVVVVWLAIYCLTVLMAEYRRQLLDEWTQRRQREQEAQKAAQAKAAAAEKKASPATAGQPPPVSPSR